MVEEVKKISLDRLLPNPWQIEGRQDPAGIEELAADFLLRGMIETPVCRPADADGLRYQLASGHRRLAAHRWLLDGGNKDFCKMRVRVASLTDEQMAGIVIAENKKRQALNPIGEAKFYKRYLAEFQVTQKQLAESMGCSQGDIGNTLRLLDLPEEVQQWIISGEITPRHGRELLRLSQWPEKQEQAMYKLRHQVATNTLLTVEQFAQHCDILIIERCQAFDGCHFDIFFCQKCDAHLVLRGKEYCQRPGCFQEKERAGLQRIAEQQKKPEETGAKRNVAEDTDTNRNTPAAPSVAPAPIAEQAVKTERQKDGVETARPAAPPTSLTPEPNYGAPVPATTNLKVSIAQNATGFMLMVQADHMDPVIRLSQVDLAGILALIPGIIADAQASWAA